MFSENTESRKVPGRPGRCNQKVNRKVFLSFTGETGRCFTTVSRNTESRKVSGRSGRCNRKVNRKVFLSFTKVSPLKCGVFHHLWPEIFPPPPLTRLPAADTQRFPKRVPGVSGS